MNLVFDMDNTLTDEFGSSARPGIHELLTKLRREGHTLILWTNSTADRARTILVEHDLRPFFSSFRFREDYDPQNKGFPKDIRKVEGSFLMDDDPAEIRYTQKIGKEAFLIAGGAAR